MKTIAIGLALAAVAVAGTALAEQAWGPPGDRNATMTRADALTRAGELFARLDVNHDGKLDPADREAEKNLIFDRIDANKDGQISRAEFAAFTPMHPGMGGPGMGGPEAGDHDGTDGSGGGPGMGHHHMGGGMHGPMGGMMLMRMADTNHDGAVSKDEFMAAATARFDRADTDRDGKLTPAERQAAREAMRAHFREMMQQGAAGGASPPAAASPPPGN